MCVCVYLEQVWVAVLKLNRILFELASAWLFLKSDVTHAASRLMGFCFAL